MNKPRQFFKDTYHHLYNRGANKSNIFFERNDYLFFLKRLMKYSNKYGIDILTYCLLPNHFHLFVKQNTNEKSISGFASSLSNSYTKSVNKKYNRTGRLFESIVKSKQIDDENYFKWVIKYILENPVKAGFCNNIVDYEFSNGKAIFGIRNDNNTNINDIKDFFQSQNQMIEFLDNKEINVNYEF